ALPELLCPAGEETALRAAVDNGADAVYLGYMAFGARASAANFNDEGLERAVQYAHLYHVRVHVTVNTLVKPSELSGVREALGVIARVGADAVIVQDLGVAAMVRDEFPTLALHASTQMALCSAADARFAQRFGFERVVLARECPLCEIRAVVDTGIETEIFVHGALCSSVSGRCLMSSMAGGRSGNRGRCAQPCRQRLSLNGQEGALLSLRDLCLLDDLPALCEAGVASLKVEGRLKSAEYVAVTASVYRCALDAVRAGTFQPGDVGAREQLLQAFNRGGFTRGHAMGARDAELCALGRVGHEGVPVGEVLSVSRGLASVRVTRALHDGDSLQIRGGEDIDLRYSGHAVEAGGTAILRLRPDVEAYAGNAVARLADAEQLCWARSREPKCIEVTMRATFAKEQPMRLQISDGECEVEALGEPVQPARSRASSAEDVRRQLAKLGDTPFTLADVDALRIELEDGLFLPVSALNALRREAVDRLTEERVRAFGKKRRGSGAKATRHAAPAAAKQALITPQTIAVLFSDASLAEQLARSGATMLLYEPRDLRAAQLEAALAALPAGTWLAFPPQLSGSTLQAVMQLLERHRDTLGGVVAANLGELALPVDLPVIAGEGVPVTNALGMRALSETPARGFTLWPEWTRTEQSEIQPFLLPCLLKVYGRETLMLLNHCPARVLHGLGAGGKKPGAEGCALCTEPEMACGKHGAELVDRKGYHFPLMRTMMPEGCVLNVLNALPTDLSANEAERRALGAGMLLRFTTETKEEQLALTRAFAGLAQGAPARAAQGQTTMGHWLRGVE
ncbi:MAG: U32 family peptidase, partial [Clostridia bacterium]